MDGALNRRGFTLFEIMIAVGLLAVVVVVLVGVFLSGVKLARESTAVTAATELGRQFLETVEQGGYDQMAVGTFDGSVPNLPDAATGFPPAPYPGASQDREQFVLKVTCADHTTNTRSVEVEVSWRNDRRVRFKTLVHQ
ncbi:MAG: prepilin-type N-terminal cleavage/methylation domain-containing protein [Vulcanimicrobiota bacterium]